MGIDKVHSNSGQQQVFKQKGLMKCQTQGQLDWSHLHMNICNMTSIIKTFLYGFSPGFQKERFFLDWCSARVSQFHLINTFMLVI